MNQVREQTPSQDDLIDGYIVYLQMESDVSASVVISVAVLAYDLHQVPAAVEMVRQLLVRTMNQPFNLRMVRAWATQIILDSLRAGAIPADTDDPFGVLSRLLHAVETFRLAVSHLTEGPKAEESWRGFRTLEDHVLEM